MIIARSALWSAGTINSEKKFLARSYSPVLCCPVCNLRDCIIISLLVSIFNTTAQTEFYIIRNKSTHVIENLAGRKLQMLGMEFPEWTENRVYVILLQEQRTANLLLW